MNNHEPAVPSAEITLITRVYGEGPNALPLADGTGPHALAFTVTRRDLEVWESLRALCEDRPLLKRAVLAHDRMAAVDEPEWAPEPDTGLGGEVWLARKVDDTGEPTERLELCELAVNARGVTASATLREIPDLTVSGDEISFETLLTAMCGAEGGA